jgi:hypothetical protein
MSDRDVPIVPHPQSCSEWVVAEWDLVVRQHCEENHAVIRRNARRVWEIRALLAQRRAG